VTVSPLGSTSTDTSPGTIVEYDWDCGNGTSETGATPTCTYHLGPAGTADVIYTIKLTVKDDGCCGLGLACQKSSPQVTAEVTVGITTP
jgi:PKD repeat protein